MRWTRLIGFAIVLCLLSGIALQPALAADTAGDVGVRATVRARVECSSAGPDAVDIRANVPWTLVATTDDGVEVIEGTASSSRVPLPEGTRSYTVLVD